MKIWGRILGMALLVKGLTLAIRPRFLFSFSKEQCGSCLPKEALDILDDYDKLSDRSLRFLGGALALVGFTMLSLAGAEPEK